MGTVEPPAKQDCGLPTKHDAHDYVSGKVYYWCTGEPPLSEFVEITVRVPIVNGGPIADGSMRLYMDDYIDRDAFVTWAADEYPTVAGFLFDWFDSPGAQVAVRLRYRGEDKYEEVWRERASEAGSAG